MASFAWLSVAVVSACATAGRAPTRDDVARGIASTPNVLAPESQRDFAWPPAVVVSDGLTIDEAVATALWNNQEFQVALASLGLARADLIQAGMIKNPILSMLLPWGPKQFEATVNLPIDAIWQRPKRVAEATLNARAVADRLMASGLQLTGDVKIQFIDALSAGRALAIATEQAQIAKRVSVMASGRFRAGEISGLERELAEEDAAKVEAVRVSRTTTRDLALNELRRLMGMPADAPAPALSTVDASVYDCGPPADLIKTALAARPDVRAAEIDVEAAAARAGIERSKILTLTAILDINAQGKDGFEAGPGLGGDVPLFSRNEGGRARVAAELEQAGRRYLAVRARVAADVSAAATRLTHAIAAAHVWTAGPAASLASSRARAQRLFEAGEISLLDQLELQRRLNESEVLRIDTQLLAARERARLEQAVGRACNAR